MGIDMFLNATGELFDLFRNEEYIDTLKGSLDKKEKTITFKPNENICKGDKLVRKVLEEEFLVLDLDILIVHEKPFYKRIVYSKENFDHINNGVNSTIRIDKNYAPINTAGGNIESKNTTMINETCNDISEIKKLIDKLIPTINQSQLNPIEKEDLKDDLDIVREQIESDKPKVSRIRKAYKNISAVIKKAFLGVKSVAILYSDWEKFVNKLEILINNIN